MQDTNKILGIETTLYVLALTALVLGLVIVLLWRVPRGITNVTGTLNKFVLEFGTNGKSTLRAEINAISERITNLHTLLTQKFETSQQVTAQLQGLADRLDKEMEEAGLDRRIREQIAEALKREVADTINVIQMGTGAVAGQVATGTTVEQKQESK